MRPAFLSLKLGAEKTAKPIVERKWSIVMKDRIDGDQTLG